MPFCKRTILPKDVCKPAARRLQQEAQRRAALEDLVDVCGFTLCSLLRQLSDLSRHSVSILEELEGDLAIICHRSCVLEGRVVRLQRCVTDLISKPPPKGRGQLKSILSRAHTGSLLSVCMVAMQNLVERIPNARPHVFIYDYVCRLRCLSRSDAQREVRECRTGEEL